MPASPSNTPPPASPVAPSDAAPLDAATQQQIGDLLWQHTGDLARVRRHRRIALVAVVVGAIALGAAPFGPPIMVGLALGPIGLGMAMLYDAHHANWRIVVGRAGVARLVGRRIDWLQRYDFLVEMRSYSMMFAMPRPGLTASSELSQVATLKFLGDEDAARPHAVALASPLHAVSPTILAMRAALLPPLVDAFERRIERGQQLPWGPWRLAQRGLVALDGRAVAWSAIRSVAIDTVNAERLVLHVDDGDGRLALLAAADALRSTRDTAAPPADPWLWIGAANFDVGLALLARRTGLATPDLPYLAIVERAASHRP